ncbi:retinitis pigmentosa 1-like 1 protein [Rhinophrynus dorsalis]
MNPSAQGYAGAPPTPEQPLPPVARGHLVTEVAPAKKITFLKSGDPQFGGIKMAISRRSFKSFSALMDDLSNRVPLPFGVRTITTPRGTHSINRLEQLEDGGRYICSDKKYVHPIAPSKPGRKLGAQRTSRPVSTRKQSRPEEEEYPDPHFQQVPKLRKKITLVKNGDPTVRRSVILNRSNGRNLKTFLEDASDLMQYTVRRLYTVDGRRIESVQAVLHSPSILICVGREPFKPIQIENVRKSFAEKLPGLRSHASVTNEAMDNKKNVNFGLKAKKSVIHPRSASSNKTRFSLSSEKSYPYGLNMSPANSHFASFTNDCPHRKSQDSSHSLVNEDIEKRVHVNKDGSLSVEMKVRFRLLNEETLQWSTQIKKSSTLGKAKCEQLCLCDEDGMVSKKEMNPEIFSETDDSFYPCDADSYCSKLNDVESEDMCCDQCGMQCRDYDIWKNPIHANLQEDYVNRSTWQTQSSASSTSSRHKVMCNQKTSIDSHHTTSSEEYTEHIVCKSSSYSKNKDNGETRVSYSAISQSTSRSCLSTATSNKDVKSENGHTYADETQHKPCHSLKSQSSLQNHHSVSEGFNSKSASFDDLAEMSPTPSCNGEINKRNCSQRVSVASRSSVQSRKSNRRMKKKDSSDTNCSESNLSFNCEEEQGSTCISTPMENIPITPSENNDCDEQDTCTQTELLMACSTVKADEMAGENDNDDDDAAASSRAGLSDSEKCSTRASSHSKTHKKTRGRKSSEHSSCKSPCSSCHSRQKKCIMVQESGSAGQCEKIDDLENSSSSADLERDVCGDSETQQSDLHPNHSVVTESTSCHRQEGQPVISSHDGCNKSSKSQTECRLDDDKMSTTEDDGKLSLPNSRPSSMSQSLSSRYNCVSCPENGNPSSINSRVSSDCDKESKHDNPCEMCDNSSSDGNMSEISQQNKKPNTPSQSGNISSRKSGSESGRVYSPSPPKEKPTNKQLRSSQLKYSSSSVCSDPAKAMNGEKLDSSRSSTPASKAIVASRASTETCKKIKSIVSSHNSTEEIPNAKKRKDSSSSSKRNLKGKYVDTGNKTELTPSALPNITSEEVVHEWLRKIPSETLVVEYEEEECQAKACEETQSGVAESETDKQAEEGDLNTNSTEEIQNTNQVKENAMNVVNCMNCVTDTPVTDACQSEEKDNIVQTNNVKYSAVTEVAAYDKKTLPFNVQTSVQIMKALLNPLQESKFDRSNSMPEVSPSMARKLSNSAQVLISCLASLELLDEGPTPCVNESKDLNKPKYAELLDILQTLWANGQVNKCVPSSKSRKQYSRENEVTPVSSSGVDVNSGFEGSGDGSLAGGGDSTVISDKLNESKLSTKANELTNTNNNNNNSTQPTELELASSVNLEAENIQCTEHAASTMIIETSACLDEANSCYVDENMNEKKIEDRNSNMEEGESKDVTVVQEYLNNEKENNINDELVETVAHKECSDDTMNILSHDENNAESNESSSQETNCINSQSDNHPTAISTSDSNVKNEPGVDKQLYEADPVWALKLLKKIENEFMTHYVDAMNEFKVRWNLEYNENLDEMIAELKNEVGQRIQRSIANELKKIKSRAGQKMPRPPNERRRSSLQTEERRKRLQTMHKRSIVILANGENNKGAGTNDTSCETDEEDLTFSASFGDVTNGILSDDEFCPCETCIKKKRALKLATPQTVAADAPIMRAFDLQQILKMKKENNETAKEEIPILSIHECHEGPHDRVNENNDTEENTAGEDSSCLVKEQMRGDDSESSDNQDERSSVVENGDGMNDDLDMNKEPDTEINQVSENEAENSDMNEEEESSKCASVNAKGVSLECPDKSENIEICEEKQHEEEQLEQEHNSRDSVNDHIEDHDALSSAEHEETKETSESGDESGAREPDSDLVEESSEHENNSADEMTIPVTNIEGDGNQENVEAMESNGSQIHRSCLAQCSLITQNGSVEDADGDFKETSSNVGETSPNSSGSKQSQMYPDSSSDDDGGASTCGSPVDMNSNATTIREHSNEEGNIEESTNKSEKAADDEAIGEDEFDF